MKIYWLLIPFLIFHLCPVTYADNLIRNPDFEEDGKYWNQWGAVSTKFSYAGAKAMQIENNIANWSGISQDIPILNGGVKVVLSGWMKTDNVIASDKVWENAQITLSFLDDNGEILNENLPKVALISGSTIWKKYSSEYDIPPEVKVIRVTAALKSKGVAFVDQMSLLQYDKHGNEMTINDLVKYEIEMRKTYESYVNSAKNGSFENGSQNWSVYKGEIIYDKKRDGKVLYFNNERFSWAGIQQEICIPDGTESIVISGWHKSENVIKGKNGWDKALLSFEFLDDSGKVTGNYPVAVVQQCGTGDWEYYAHKYKATLGAKKIKVYCQMCNSKGKAWFDDIKVMYFNSQGKQLQCNSKEN